MTVHAPRHLWPDWQGEPAQFAPGREAQAVQAAIDWLESLCGQWTLPGKLALAIGLCADELLANVTSHARRPDGSAAEIGLRLGKLAGGIGLLVSDDGAVFDLTAQESPELAASLDDAVPGGHGLRLIRHYTRAMHYRREAGRNQLLLEFDYPS